MGKEWQAGTSELPGSAPYIVHQSSTANPFVITSHRIVMGYSMWPHCAWTLVKLPRELWPPRCILDERSLERSARQRWYALLSRKIVICYLMVTALLVRRTVRSR